MKSFRDRNPYLVGVVSMAILALLVAVAFAVGILQVFKPRYVVQAVFTDAAGVTAGDDVRIAGIEVGKVKGIKVERGNGTVQVDLDIYKGVDVPVSASAEIVLETLLGTKFVRLTGPATGPWMKGLDKAQRRIPVERTKTPFDFFRLGKALVDNVQATDGEKLNQVISSFADITENQREDLDQLLDGVVDLSKVLNDREAQLRQLLDRAEGLARTLADKDQTFVNLIDQSKRILDLLNTRAGDIGRLLRTSNALTVELLRILDVNKAALDEILGVLHPTLDVVEERQADVIRAVPPLAEGSFGLAKASAHGPWQDIYVQALGPDLIEVIGGLGGG